MQDLVLRKKVLSGRPLTEDELMRYIQMEIRRQNRDRENETNQDGNRIYTLLWRERHSTHGKMLRVEAANSHDALANNPISPLSNAMAFPVILPDSLVWRGTEEE